MGNWANWASFFAFVFEAGSLVGSSYAKANLNQSVNRLKSMNSPTTTAQKEEKVSIYCNLFSNSAQKRMPEKGSPTPTVHSVCTGAKTNQGR